MYCPDCGATNEASQNFCRKCGFELKEVSAALEARRPRSITRDRRSNPVALLAKIALFGVEGLTVLGLGTFIVAMIRDMIYWGVEGVFVFMAIAAAILLVIITCAIVLAIIAVNKKFAPNSFRTTPPASAPQNSNATCFPLPTA
jgi:C4-type Zn-finger protein